MFNMNLTFDEETDNISLTMPIVPFLYMVEIIMSNIHPEALTTRDSVGEAALIQFIQKSIQLNQNILEGDKASTIAHIFSEVQDILDSPTEE